MGRIGKEAANHQWWIRLLVNPPTIKETIWRPQGHDLSLQYPYMTPEVPSVQPSMEADNVFLPSGETPDAPSYVAECQEAVRTLITLNLPADMALVDEQLANVEDVPPRSSRKVEAGGRRSQHTTCLVLLPFTMSLLHPHGQTCPIGELDLHALPLTQKDVLKSQTITKTTNNALTDHTDTFDFMFEPTALYTDLSETELYIEFEVVDATGTALAADSNAAPINNIGHSLFSSVQLLINGEKVTGNNGDYAFKATMLDLVGLEKKRQRKHACWGARSSMNDTASHMESRGDDNTGFIAQRVEFCARKMHMLLS